MALIAFMLDLLVGDPAFLVRVHPVVLAGHLIKLLEKLLYRKNSRIMGVLLVIVVCLSFYYGTKFLLTALGPIAWVIEIWLLTTAFAARGLYEAGMKIYKALQLGNLELARRRTGEIVGRDTHSMTRLDLIRAAVESVAENLVDGVTAPLVYALIGGAPLAILYKAINTMDSMLGHKDERYYYFGWAAARLDDLANFIPARLTVPAMALAAHLLGLNAAYVWRAILRDAHKHKSPNSGISEAGVAGALGVQLGGINYYGGEIYESSLLGNPIRELTEEDIPNTCRLMLLTSVIFLIGGNILKIFFKWQVYVQ